MRATYICALMLIPGKDAEASFRRREERGGGVGTTATLGILTTGTPDVTAVGNYIANGNVALRGVTLTGRAVSTNGSVQLNGRIVPAN